MLGSIVAMGSSVCAMNEAREAQKAYVAAGRSALDRLAMMYGLSTTGPAIKVGPTKCPCCGSRETRYHHSKRICAYCRSEV